MKLHSILTNTLILIFTVLFFASCEKTDDAKEMQSKTYAYTFNKGQINSAYAYSGNHTDNLTAELTITEKKDGKSMVSVKLTNAMDGKTYMVHAHDAADPTMTPNNTPYNETPNSSVLALQILGSDAEASQESTKSFEELTTTYSGFFVIHDPLINVNTQDPTTYVILGNFAR